LENPKREFFFPNEIKSLPLNEIYGMIDDNFIGIEIDRPKLIDDVIYPQIRKGMESIIKLCDRYDFNCERADFYLNEKILIIMEFRRSKLSNEKIHRGPPIDAKSRAESFLEKWEKDDRRLGEPFKKNGRWWIKIRRDYTNVRDLLKEKMREIDIGKDLNGKIFRVLIGKELIKEEYAKFLTKYFDGRLPWEI
jgi:tRNA nucleotidyltransferase (CCA-adding enzyme)